MDAENLDLFDFMSDYNKSSVFHKIHLDFLDGNKEILQILMVCFSSVGWIGNMLICYVIITLKSMQTPTNFYLFSMAVSDTLILIGFSFGAIDMIWFSRRMSFVTTCCRVVQCTASFATISATVAITVDRYIAITRPFTSRKLFNKRRTINIILCIWLYSFTYSLFLNSCISNLFSFCEAMIIHRLEALFAMSFFLPFTVILILYTLIALHIRKSLRMRKLINNKRGSFKRNRSLTKGLSLSVAVVTEFIVCWGPLHIILLTYRSFGIKFSVIRSTCLHFVIGINLVFTVINPMIYSIMSNEFRKAFGDVLCRRKGLRKQERVFETCSFRRTISTPY